MFDTAVPRRINAFLCPYSKSITASQYSLVCTLSMAKEFGHEGKSSIGHEEAKVSPMWTLSIPSHAYANAQKNTRTCTHTRRCTLLHVVSPMVLHPRQVNRTLFSHLKSGGTVVFMYF